MKELPLTQGYVALVDDEDYERLRVYKWHAVVIPSKNKTAVYAARGIWTEKRRIYMHREILACKEKVDHRDTNGLNNQRYNLRPATKSQNNMNQRKSRGSSRFKGVAWDKIHGAWQAGVKKDGIRHHIGTFRDEADAAQAYNFKAEELFGPYARLNTPEGC